MTDDLVRRGNLEGIHTGRMPRENEGRNQGYAAVSQGLSKLTGIPPKAR